MFLHSVTPARPDRGHGKGLRINLALRPASQLTAYRLRIRMRTETTISRLFCQIIVASMAIGVSAACWGDTQVYKTVDAQGNVVYTDKAPTVNAQKTNIQVHQPSAADLERVEQQKKAIQATDERRVAEAIADKASQAQKQKQLGERQARCQQARNNFYNLKDATRIYQRDAQGNRVYLPDDQADAKRSEARKAMDAACGP